MWPQGFLEQSWEITSLVLASVLCVKKNSSQRGTRLCPEPLCASDGAGAQAVAPVWHPLGTAPSSSVVWGSAAGESSARLLTEEATGRPGGPGRPCPLSPACLAPGPCPSFLWRDFHLLLLLAHSGQEHVYQTRTCSRRRGAGWYDQSCRVPGCPSPAWRVREGFLEEEPLSRGQRIR